MTRTDELRQDGARDRTSGGAFVRWPESGSYAFVEGEVRELWESEYGPAVKVGVTRARGVTSGSGGQVGAGETVNVGLNYAALQDAVSARDVGEVLHFAFEGWGETKSGDQFRKFAVLEVPREQPPIAEPDDDLPF